MTTLTNGPVTDVFLTNIHRSISIIPNGYCTIDFSMKIVSIGRSTYCTFANVSLRMLRSNKSVRKDFSIFFRYSNKKLYYFSIVIKASIKPILNITVQYSKIHFPTKSVYTHTLMFILNLLNIIINTYSPNILLENMC